MVDIERIYHYFPHLSASQKRQIEQLYPLYAHWNEQINVISRKDIEALYIKHVLHAMSIAHFIRFDQIRSVLDFGTGGGFPGIPLAILYPETKFHCVDSIGKKIKVVEAIAESLGLHNVKAEHARAEQIQGKYDLITCRAVTRLIEFYPWIHKNLKPDSEIACLKGGDLVEEIFLFKKAYPKKKVKVFELSDHFIEEFFETKKLLRIT